jgi:hypothetical protein
MVEFTRYYGSFRGVRGQWGGLPSWARFIVGVFAIPGLAMLALSILAIVVSLLALFLLAVPVYLLLARVTGGAQAVQPVVESPGAKRVEATIVESTVE